MLPSPGHLGIVRFQAPEYLNPGGQAGAAQQMPRGVLVAAGTVLVQGKSIIARSTSTAASLRLPASASDAGVRTS